VFREPGMQDVLDRLAGSPFDVVHVLDNAMAAYRRPDVTATILSEHEVRVDADDGIIDGAVLPSVEEREAEQQRWWRYQADVWTQFDRVQVFTERDAESVRRLAPGMGGRLFVNPFGVELPAAPPARQPEPDTLVFVGGFKHPPNVDAALWLVRDILPPVRARRPATHLTIVGADPPAVVRDLASEAVTVTGRVETIDPYVQSAAVVVAPLRAGGGMRLKVLQAMAWGRPVVTTSRGAEGIWNPSAAPTIQVAEDAHGIASHIIALLDSDDARKTLGARARAAVIEHHRWDQFAARLTALYDGLSQSGAAA
jgi:polysaccharide biosynthesis protein PslH